MLSGAAPTYVKFAFPNGSPACTRNRTKRNDHPCPTMAVVAYAVAFGSVSRAMPDAPSTKRPILHTENPGGLVERILGADTGEIAVNPLLKCTSVGFCRYRGDWLGVVITPWLMDLVLLPGCGELWGDIPPGQRRYVDLPQGTVAFSAAESPELGSYQHAPLVASVATLPDMSAAVGLANQVMAEICMASRPPETPSPTLREPGEALPDTPDVPSRRGFFQRLVGKR
jgi:[NiFe] hydrogenase assembly HybE family chaperone